MEEYYQKCLNNLEEYKRRLGRSYAKAPIDMKAHYRSLYNSCEDAISQIATKYRLKRSSKPYKLKEVT